MTIHSSHPYLPPEEQRDPARRLRGLLPSPVTIWSSADGVTWEKDSGNGGFVPSGYMGAASYNGKLFISSGLTKDMYVKGIWVK